MKAAGAACIVAERTPPRSQLTYPGSSGRTSAYFALRIDGLTSSPLGLSGSQRGAEGLVRSLRRFAGRVAVELRIQVDPEGSASPTFALIVRAWGEANQQATMLAQQVEQAVGAALPPTIVANPITIKNDLARLLNPYGDAVVQAASITKREVITAPSRPDAGRSFYFGVPPLIGGATDWAALYAALSTTRLPLTFSLAIFPVTLPIAQLQEIRQLADEYARLGSEQHIPGGLYFGPRRLPPDRPAAMAATSLERSLTAWPSGTSVARVLVVGPQVPVDLVELLGSAIASNQPTPGGHEMRYEIRWQRTAEALTAARWNLATLDCYPTVGRPAVWNRPDRLPRHFESLSVLLDTEEMLAVFQLPTPEAGANALLPVLDQGTETSKMTQADVVVLTTTSVEGTALEQALTAVGARRDSVEFRRTNTYTLYRGIDGTVVAHVRCSMGASTAGASALTISAAIDDLKPWAVVAVGIAFGMDRERQPLSTLLLSERLAAYEPQRLGEQGPSHDLHAIQRGPITEGSPALLSRFRDSHLEEDLGISIKAGLVLSGEKLVDNTAFMVDLRERFPEAIGGEMEGAGVLAASHRANVNWLVVKAVCDHGPGKGAEKEGRQTVAATVAAKAFAAVLSLGGLRRPR